MLALPTFGINRSINEHNVELDVLCDWIEGSILFDEEELSTSDVLDILIEGNIYVKQEFAWEIVNAAWGELRRRQGSIERGSPLEIDGPKLKRLRKWQDVPGHSFCVALALAKWYPSWANGFGKGFNRQGELFERLTKESLERVFPYWKIHLTGWSRTNAQKLRKVVEDVAESLGEPIGEIERWTKAKANEAGLDLLCHHSFEDGRVGTTVYLIQCASGKHYEGKLHTPDLRVWGRIVQFTSDPKKAFATPFALTDAEFIRVCNLVNGLLLDRYRLLSPSRTASNWLSKELKKEIVAWLKPRIEKLPRADK